MADMRARARESLTAPDVRPADLPDSGLIEMIRVAHVRRAPALVVEAVTELLRRLDYPVTVTKTPVTVTKTQAPVLGRKGANIRQRSYPTAVKTMAVQLQREGASNAAILRAIKEATGGPAPDRSNLVRTLARWAETAD
jgi:hypothetical protein